MLRADGREEGSRTTTFPCLSAPGRLSGRGGGGSARSEPLAPRRTDTGCQGRGVTPPRSGDRKGGPGPGRRLLSPQAQTEALETHFAPSGAVALSSEPREGPRAWRGCGLPGILLSVPRSVSVAGGVLLGLRQTVPQNTLQDPLAPPPPTLSPRTGVHCYRALAKRDHPS